MADRNGDDSPILRLRRRPDVVNTGGGHEVNIQWITPTVGCFEIPSPLIGEKKVAIVLYIGDAIQVLAPKDEFSGVLLNAILLQAHEIRDLQRGLLSVHQQLNKKGV